MNLQMHRAGPPVMHRKPAFRIADPTSRYGDWERIVLGAARALRQDRIQVREHFALPAAIRAPPLRADHDRLAP